MKFTPLVTVRPVNAPHVRGASRTGPLKYMPGFVYILALFIVGKFIFPDQRDTLIEWGPYHLSWVEVLMVAAAMMAMAEQLKVSYPGVDNTIEAILMGAVAGIQVLLFALGAARRSGRGGARRLVTV